MEGKLTINQASECLHKSRQTIMQWIKEGKFPNAQKDSGITGWWFIPISDVENVRQEIILEYQTELNAISKHPQEWLR